MKALIQITTILCGTVLLTSFLYHDDSATTIGKNSIQLVESEDLSIARGTEAYVEGYRIFRGIRCNN